MGLEDSLKLRILKLAMKGLFWLLLPGFGLCLGYGLLALQMFKTRSLFQFTQILGAWVLVWLFFGFAAKQVFKSQVNLKRLTNDEKGDQPALMLIPYHKKDN